MMDGRNEHENIDLLLPDYILGVLKGEEIRRVEGHVQECRDCTQQVANDAFVFSSLALSPELVAPPSYLRSKILAAVMPAPVAAARQKPSPWWRTQQALIAALVAPWAVTMAMAGTAMMSPRTATAHMMVMSISEGRKAVGQFVGMNTERHGYLLLPRMPAAPAGSYYTCWLIKQKQMDKACTFNGSSSKTFIQVPVAGRHSIETYEKLVVTVESGPPSSTPHGMLLAAALIS